MGTLILGIVMNVLIHVLIELCHGIVVSGISSAVRLFTVLNASEFVVLDPEIRFENLCRGREPEERSIASTQARLGTHQFVSSCE